MQEVRINDLLEVGPIGLWYLHVQPPLLEALRFLLVLPEYVSGRFVSAQVIDERMYVMSIVAALFLPLGFFTGLMGINVGGMPGVDSAWGFWVVSGFCTLVLIGLYTVFRRKGWW